MRVVRTAMTRREAVFSSLTDRSGHNIMKRFVVVAVMLAFAAPALRGQTGNDLFQQALSKERAEGRLDDAIKLYERIVKEFSADRPLAAKALLQLGRAYERLDRAEARRAYERLVQEFGDQRSSAAEARIRLAALRPPPANGMTARRIWSGSEEVYAPPTADGRSVAMVDPATGNVVLVDLVTGRRRLLTKAGPGEGAIASIVAPDGRQVVYSWYGSYGTAAEDSFELRASATDGSAPRVLYRNPEIAYVYPADWSPDRRRLLLLVGRKDRTKQIAIFDLGTATLRVLKTTGWNGPGGPMFSPDGRYLVYDLPQDQSAGRDVFVMTTDGSRETALVRHPANDRVLGWMPDGKRILIQSDRSQSNDAWVIHVADGKPVGVPELVKRDLGRINPIGFSRSGAYFYSVNTTLREIYVSSVDLPGGRIETAPAAPIPNFVGQKEAVDWSPNGLSIAYVPLRPAGQRGGRPILIRDLASGDERELKTPFNYVMKLRWSPDGDSIAFRATDGTHGWGLHRIDTRTGVVTAIDARAGSISDLAWSPDGARMFYATPGNVFVRDVATGDVKPIHQGSPTQWATWLALSPDGGTLAVTDQNDEMQWSAVKILPAAGGATRELLRVRAPEGFSGGLAWTSDGRNLLIARSNKRGSQAEQTELWRVPIDGGPPQRLGSSGVELRDLRLHADQRQVAYVAGQYRTEIWVMENILP